MRKLVLLTLLFSIAGCTVSASNHHFELNNYSSKEYDDFNNIWCFTAEESLSVVVCSGPYKRRSQSIGLIVPLLPQTNRESRLAYDVSRERVVEFKNTDSESPVTLGDLKGIGKCSSEYAEECKSVSTITVGANSTVWLKLPKGETHEFSMSIGALKFQAKLKEFNETRWHLVSV